MIKTIIFDFDGVILETNEIKLQAFLSIFQDCSQDVQDKIAQLHLENDGVSRTEKFRIIREKFLNQPFDPIKIKELEKTFAIFCADKIKKASWVNGVFEFIHFAYKKYSLYIVSAAPESEIKEIVAERKLEKYFQGVYGHPRSKSELYKMILEKEHIGADEALCIGDSLGDFNSAQNNSINFVARIHEHNQELFENKRELLTVKDFRGFEHLLEKINHG